jgi:hypothetical protein
MNNTKVTFFIILLLFLTSCSGIEMSNSVSVEKSQKINSNPPQGGFEFNFDLENYITTEQIHFIKESEPYKANVEIINHFPIENSFRLFFLLDSKLINVNSNGKDVNYIDYNSLRTGISTKKTFELPKLESGKHELIILLVRNPELQLDKEEFTNFENFGKRFIIVVGENKEDNYGEDTRDILVINNDSDDYENKSNNITYLVPHGESVNPENAMTLKKHNSPKLSASLNFWNNKSDKRYSIIALDNDKQIVLKNSIFKVKNVGNVILDLEINLTKEKVHNLILVIVGNPGQTPEVPSEDLLTTNKITLIKD